MLSKDRAYRFTGKKSVVLCLKNKIFQKIFAKALALWIK